jgi:hypothetical protein
MWVNVKINCIFFCSMWVDVARSYFTISQNQTVDESNVPAAVAL